jgi:hypothetical protein
MESDVIPGDARYHITLHTTQPDVAPDCFLSQIEYYLYPDSMSSVIIVEMLFRIEKETQAELARIVGTNQEILSVY